MSYDVLLSQVQNVKLNDGNNAQRIINPTEGAQDNEQPAAIIEKPLRKPPEIPVSTPRKISSSRIMNAFSQFYTNYDDDSSGSTSIGCTSSGRTPTRNMETKLMSMWHNVKYGWSGKMRSSFSKEQPVWLLGRCYHRKCTPPSSMESSAELTTSMENKACMFDENGSRIDESLQEEVGLDAIEGQNSESPWEEGIDGFKRDFQSRLWLTYRREFPIMNGSNYTSDCGWGCMLRSGQMLLAQALVSHFLGRSWRWDPETQLHSTYDDNMHRKIIRWFGDNSSKSSPFSIHTLVTLGEEMGKKPGDWYGPASVSHLLRQAIKKAAREIADLDDINVYVAPDCTVYIQDILDECLVPEPPKGITAPWQLARKISLEQQLGVAGTADNTTDQTQMHWKSLIILVPLRLGADKLNPNYAHCLKTLLSTEYCIGVIGGRPRHSLYFVGFQEDKLIHLDPHYCQEMVDVNQENFTVNSFHCKSPRKLKASKIDPSCCIGFYCQAKIDFDNFVASVQPYLQPIRISSNNDKLLSGSPSQMPDSNYPMFAFSRGRNTDYHKDENSMSTSSDSPFKPLIPHEQSSKMTYLVPVGPASSFPTTNTSNNTDYDDDEDETEEFVIL